MHAVHMNVARKDCLTPCFAVVQIGTRLQVPGCSSSAAHGMCIVYPMRPTAEDRILANARHLGEGIGKGFFWDEMEGEYVGALPIGCFARGLGGQTLQEWEVSDQFKSLGMEVRCTAGSPRSRSATASSRSPVWRVSRAQGESLSIPPVGFRCRRPARPLPVLHRLVLVRVGMP